MASHRERFGPPILLLASLVVVGCATGRKSLVVLLPEEGNTSAAVKVTNQGGSQVLTEPFQATEVAGPDRAPAKPVTLDQATVQREFGEALSAMPAPPVSFILYFESDSTELTAESKGRLPSVLETVAKRLPAEVAVVGHTDTMGTPERNVKLGMDRAVAVANLLESLGVAASSLEISSHGEADLLVQTGDEVAEPRNRRVVVTVR